MLDEVAGRGAMGVVYRAHHAVSGETVALKTLHALRPDLASFLDREILGLARVDHPQVVRIVDHGTDTAGRPWLAMRWLHGEDLSTLLPTPLTQGEEVPAERVAGAVELAAKLCAPLGWMHGNGLVHGDLKPSNIRISGGLPTLLDLGLAQAMRDLEGREQSAGAGLSAGSRGYMSPEQRGVELLDGRADLWALGAVLFALLTGRPPSSRDTRGSVHRLRGVDPGLRSLLEDLLQDDPRARPAFAEDVAGRIAALGGPRVLVRAPPALHRPRCRGRRALIDALVEGARDGGVHAIVGTSGHGKTRVLLELAGRMTRARRRVIGAAAERHDAQPYGLLAPILRAVARRCERDGVAGAAMRAVVEVMPVLRTISTELDHVPGLTGHAPAGVVEPEVARERLAKAVWRATAGLAHGLFFDDVQWADPRFLELLPALIRARPPGRALLLAWRGEEAGPALRELDVVVHTLDPLPHDAIRDLLSDMLADPRALPDTVAEIAQRAEGNPWFAAEMLRAAVELGRVTRERGTWVRTGELPAAQTVERLVDARWDALEAQERELIEVAAVLGRAWSLEVLSEVLGQSPALTSLVRRGWVQRGAEGRWAFTHAILRDGALQRTPPERTRELHGRAADVLTARRGSGRFLDIAHHRAAAGQRELAIQTYLDIARGHPYLEPDVVIAAAEALLGMGAAVPRETQVLALLWMGTDHAYMQRMAQAEACRARLLQDYRDVEGVERLVLGMQIEADRGVRPLEHNLALCRRALALPRFRDRTHDIYLLYMAGNMLLDAGRVAEALARFEEGVPRVDDSARPHLVRSLYMCLGKAHGALHEWPAMEAWFERAVGVSETVGAVHSGTMEWCRAQREIAEDDLAAAHRRLSACRQTFAGLGGPRQLLGVDASLAEVELTQGELEAAWLRIDAVTTECGSVENTAAWSARLVRARVARVRGHAVDDAVLAELERRAERAGYPHLVLRARLERTWGQPLSTEQVGRVQACIEACAELLQPNSMLERLVRAWSDARPA